MAILKDVPGVVMLPPVNNGKQLLTELQISQADLVILDLNMPELDGIKTLEIIKKQFPEIKVIVLTNYNQPQLIEEIKRLGAQGYLLKDTPSDILKTAICSVISGDLYFDEYKEPVTQDNHFFTDDFMKKFQLTGREIEIIRMVCLGETSKEIGERLFISEFTVRTHRRNIMKKLEVKNLAGLLAFATTHGLVVD